MTFLANETSNQASPIELYQFTRGLDTWRYTSYDSNITFQAGVYTPNQISRGKIEWQQEIERSELTVAIPRTDPLAAEYVAFPPTEVLNLTIYRQHFFDGDSEFLVYWQGRMLNVEFKGSICELTCETVFTSMKRPGIRRKYAYQCPHVLYGAQCGVTDETFRVNGTLTAIGSLTISAAEWGAFPDDYFTGGRVVYDTFQRREIMGHVGNTLTISQGLSGVSLGSVVAAYPGCAHNIDDCVDKFNNIENYGGFPFTGPNPFGGRSIF